RDRSRDGCRAPLQNPFECKRMEPEEILGSRLGARRGDTSNGRAITAMPEYGEWSLVFISNKLLALRPFERAFLATAAQVAVGRIEAIVKNPCRGRKKSTKTDLTPRELEVVQQRALLGWNAAIAKSLNISLKTVDVHLRSARKKLKTDDSGAPAIA